jgi:hypothetical protein
LIALLKVGITPDVCPIGYGEHHHARVIFTIEIDISESSFGHFWHRELIGERRGVEVRSDLTQYLRLDREDEVSVSVDETGLIFENHEGFGHARCEEGVGVKKLAAHRSRTTFIIDDIRRGELRTCDRETSGVILISSALSPTEGPTGCYEKGKRDDEWIKSKSAKIHDVLLADSLQDVQAEHADSFFERSLEYGMHIAMGKDEVLANDPKPRHYPTGSTLRSV